jgi:twitching motility protein PilT
MTLDSLVAMAREQGASDLHLEGGLPPTLRVRGVLRPAGEPIPASDVAAMARRLLDEGQWEDLGARRSADLARTISGVRCRVNVLHSTRGLGMAVRLLSSSQATLRRLNLHPDARRLVEPTHGLVLVTGPTGSGKTSTLAALVQEINAGEPRHVITLECPVEYPLRPLRSFIRQREVGRDTPSFQQGLLDALREDPDVLMVGEMRDAETMRLTLHAAETGHLVLATMHSSSAAEALQRLVASFAPEAQPATCAILADCLVGVLSQHLRFHPKAQARVPECEILLATHPVRAVVRQGQFHKLASAMEGGGQDGQWTLARYREWLDRKTDWQVPSSVPGDLPEDAPPTVAAPAPRAPREEGPGPGARRGPARPKQPEDPAEEGVIVLSDEDSDLFRILKDMDRKR